MANLSRSTPAAAYGRLDPVAFTPRPIRGAQRRDADRSSDYRDDRPLTTPTPPLYSEVALTRRHPMTTESEPGPPGHRAATWDRRPSFPSPTENRPSTRTAGANRPEGRRHPGPGRSKFALVHPSQHVRRCRNAYELPQIDRPWSWCSRRARPTRHCRSLSNRPTLTASFHISLGP